MLKLRLVEVAELDAAVRRFRRERSRRELYGQAREAAERGEPPARLSTARALRALQLGLVRERA